MRVDGDGHSTTAIVFGQWGRHCHVYVVLWLWRGKWDPLKSKLTSHCLWLSHLRSKNWWSFGIKFCLISIYKYFQIKKDGRCYLEIAVTAARGFVYTATNIHSSVPSLDSSSHSWWQMAKGKWQKPKSFFGRIRQTNHTPPSRFHITKPWNANGGITS